VTVDATSDPRRSGEESCGCGCSDLADVGSRSVRSSTESVPGAGPTAPEGRGPGTTITPATLARGYGTVAELLLHPDDRDGSRLPRTPRDVVDIPREVSRSVWVVLGNPEAWSSEDYAETFGSGPEGLLHLGSHLSREPDASPSFDGSERARYRMGLRDLYRRFGRETSSGELPDYAPRVADFLASSLEEELSASAAFRRRCLESYVKPALPPFQKRLEEAKSCYRLVAEAWALLVDLDLERLSAVERLCKPGGTEGKGHASHLPAVETDVGR